MRVRAAPVRCARDGKRPCQADVRGFGRGVRVTSRRPVEGSGCRVDDASEASFDHVRPRRSRQPESGVDVHSHAEVEVIGRQLLDRRVPGDGARIVNHAVNPTKRLQTRLNRVGRTFLRREISCTGDRFAAGGPDLFDDRVSDRSAATVAVDLHPAVRDDDVRTSGGEEQRMASTEASSRAGDQDHPVVESDLIGWHR
jgi:hypothetical protein